MIVKVRVKEEVMMRGRDRWIDNMDEIKKIVMINGGDEQEADMMMMMMMIIMRVKEKRISDVGIA